MANETQESITQWAVETFGPTHPSIIAARMLKEVAELVSGLASTAGQPVDEMDPAHLHAMQLECADVNIMLQQVAEVLQVDLAEVTDYKMGINRNRAWAKGPSGDFQHVEQPKEIPTDRGLAGPIVSPVYFNHPDGSRIEPEQWYIVNHRTATVEPAGFSCASAAVNHAKRVYGPNVRVPTFSGTVSGWWSGDDFQASTLTGLPKTANSVVKGSHLIAWWTRSPEHTTQRARLLGFTKENAA